MSIEIEFTLKQVYETECEEEALQWANEEIRTKTIKAEDLEIQIVKEDETREEV
jgi:hypothetical protein